MSVNPCDLVFFDVETPNINNDRICSFALVFGDGSEPFYTLVNPEVDFDALSVRVHGIEWNDVADAPTFAQIWPTIRDVFCSKIVVGHNVGFDLNVLAKTLQAYGFALPPICCVDTLAAARVAFPEFPSHKLNDLCDAFGIELEHHNALSDAVATANVFDVIPEDACRLRDFCFVEPAASVSTQEIVRATNELVGFVHGILCDQVVNAEELDALKRWAADHERFRASKHFAGVFEAVDALIDRVEATGGAFEDVAPEVDAFFDEIDSLNVRSRFSLETQFLQRIGGFIKGIAADRVLNRLELECFAELLDELEPSERPAFFATFEDLTQAALNGSEEAQALLMQEFRKCLCPCEAEESNDSPEIVFKGSLFVLTGEFCGGKGPLRAQIEELGGVVRDSVTKKTSFVVVGSPSPSWGSEFGGTKIKTAQKYQAQGISITIIKEATLREALKR